MLIYLYTSKEFEGMIKSENKFIMQINSGVRILKQRHIVDKNFHFPSHLRGGHGKIKSTNHLHNLIIYFSKV